MPTDKERRLGYDKLKAIINDEGIGPEERMIQAAQMEDISHRLRAPSYEDILNSVLDDVYPGEPYNDQPTSAETWRQVIRNDNKGRPENNEIVPREAPLNPAFPGEQLMSNVPNYPSRSITPQELYANKFQPPMQEMLPSGQDLMEFYLGPFSGGEEI